MHSGYKSKSIQVQMLMEMKDAVEEEDEDEGESDVLGIQYAAQSSMRLSSMIKRVLPAPDEISSSSSQLYHVGFPLFASRLHRCDCSGK